jgi:hypothetical protein
MTAAALVRAGKPWGEQKPIGRLVGKERGSQ